jgi:hypothetical protein
VSKLIRQTHRWLFIIFTATVIANFVAMALGEPPVWVVYSPLPPLFLMLVTHALSARSKAGYELDSRLLCYKRDSVQEGLVASLNRPGGNVARQAIHVEVVVCPITSMNR